MRIEIHSIDERLAERIGKKLATKIVSLGGKAQYSSPNSTLLGRAIRLLKTYKAIPVDPVSAVLLDTVKEWQNHKENIHPYTKINIQTKELLDKDMIIVKAGSYVLNVLSQIKRHKVGERMVKSLVKKFGKYPDMFLYLEVSTDKLSESRVKRDNKRKFEYSYRGPRAFYQNKKFISLMGQISKKIGSKYGIIQVDGKSDEDILDQAWEELTKQGIISED